jgi:predicted AAA+ superfamily ATPase
MEKLIEYSHLKVSNISLDFVRYLYDEINWDDRLIGITGARGTGKTTLLLQYLKKNHGNSEKAVYVSLDDFYFTNNRLFDFAETFYKYGGRYLFLDEVHRYAGWSLDIKNLFDTFSDLKIVFSGSSALQLHKAQGDLSRRAAMYHLHELSFREYLNLSSGLQLPAFGLNDILQNHTAIISGLLNHSESILSDFKKYLESGMYPFFTEARGQFYNRLLTTVNVVIENDLAILEKLNYQTVFKLKKIVALIADSVPFKINISELSRKSGLSRDLLIRLLNALDRANIINTLRQTSSPTGHLTKPVKVYLNNTTLLKALNSNVNPAVGTVRETFFLNQLIQRHTITYPKKGDFFVDNKYIFEIGGKNKTSKQIAGMANAYIAADDIEYGFSNKIPLWIFGFLY